MYYSPATEGIGSFLALCGIVSVMGGIGSAISNHKTRATQTQVTREKQALAKEAADFMSKKYGFDPSIEDNEAAKKKLYNDILKNIQNRLQRYRRDKSLRQKVRGEITRNYGVDRELLSEIDDDMIIFDPDTYRQECAVQYTECSQEIAGILCDLVAVPIIKELEKDYAPLVKAGLVKFDHADGDEGLICYWIAK